MVHLDFKATNNMTEYKGLIFELSAMLSIGVCQVLVKGNSQLIIKKSRENAVAMIPVGLLQSPCQEVGKGF
jgi:ribonuclease HI